MERFFGTGRLLQKFDTCRTVYLCCDIQDRLRPVIANFDEAVIVSNAMSQLQQLLGDAHGCFVATEQSPQNIGPIAKNIVLPPTAPRPFPKMQPSMLTEDVLPYIIGDPARGLKPVQQAVLWGHESQVCIINTADALLSRNIRVALAVDGCSAQDRLSHDSAIQTMAHWEGLVLTTVGGVGMQLTKGDPSVLKSFMKIMKLFKRERAIVRQAIK